MASDEDGGRRQDHLEGNVREDRCVLLAGGMDTGCERRIKAKLARTKTCLSPFESEKKATSCIGNSGTFLIVGSVRIYHPPDHFLVGCAISFCFLLKKIYT